MENNEDLTYLLAGGFISAMTEKIVNSDEDSACCIFHENILSSSHHRHIDRINDFFKVEITPLPEKKAVSFKMNKDEAFRILHEFYTDYQKEPFISGLKEGKKFIVPSNPISDYLQAVFK